MKGGPRRIQTVSKVNGEGVPTSWELFGDDGERRLLGNLWELKGRTIAGGGGEIGNHAPSQAHATRRKI